jgi:predicted unusual protein kinase regulating ubiquinone biosynthesis (AarF/ABC1/UbiB family)
MPPKRIKKIKSSGFARGFSLAKMTMGTAAGLAAQGLREALRAKGDNTWGEFVQSQAFKLSSELGELKGSLMKAGQMLSMLGEHFLPPEANQFLKNLQSESPFLAWPEIDKQLKRQLDKAQLAQLQIDTNPLAAASLGQVHRATIIATQTDAVVKVQYPGVNQSIDSDLRALKLLLSLARLLPKELSTDALFDEVKTMLKQEADYSQEAHLMETYRTLLGPDSRYVIPRLYPELSSQRVLTLSYEPGVRADAPEVAVLAQERRNHLARNFLALYFRELFEWGLVQTDPHMGNYQIRIGKSLQDDQIILLDFGATRQYPETFLRPYRRLLKASLYQDAKHFNEAAYELQFIRPDDSENLKRTFFTFCSTSMEPFLNPDDPRLPPGCMDQNGDYDWQGTDLAQRLSKLIYQLIRAYGSRTPPRDVLFLDRKTGGVFVFLKVLKARFRARDLITPYFDKIDF